MLDRLESALRPEKNRRYLYGVVEACLYAAVGFGVITAEAALLLLAVPAAVLGLARVNVRNPD